MNKKILNYFIILLIFGCIIINTSSINAKALNNNEANAFYTEYSTRTLVDEKFERDSTVFNNFTENSMRSIIGDDGRNQVANTTLYPYSAIAFIRVTWKNSLDITRGTAWIVSDNVAVTAAHCIYNEDRGGFAERVEICPAKNGLMIWNNPYGKAQSTTLYVSNAYMSSEDLGSDWGLIAFDKPLGQETGVINYRATNDAELDNMFVEIAGYPSEIGLLPTYQQYTMSGFINSFTYSRLFYSIDTSGGQSGSPILDSNNIAIGIHTRAIDGNGYNSGVRFFEGVCKSIQEIILKNQ